ncbi:MAG: lysophospholipid acyltransferase family protein [Alcanivoracaceae bacterium]|nr:lysophospholipid acyltransferase family protein [Alcanivoracaceae bacterium]
MNFKKIKTDFAITFAKLLAKLPIGLVLMLGRFLGRLTWLVPNKRKKIAARNIELCFPELSDSQQKNLLKKNLISTGQGFAETLIAYWGKQDKFMDDFQFSGLEHVEQAFAENKGCILLSCHLHSMELVIRAINLTIKNKGYMLARQHNNKIFEAHIDKARRAHCEKTIDKKDIRTVLKSLKLNQAVFYVPDQNFSYQCLYVDFFKQPAATVVAPARLAQSSKAAVIPWFGFREKDHWTISFLKPLEFFQDKDTESSLKQMNELFELHIRKHPEQYLWVHRRFKNHPKGKNYVYKDL